MCSRCYFVEGPRGPVRIQGTPTTDPKSQAAIQAVLEAAYKLLEATPDQTEGELPECPLGPAERLV